MTSIPTILVIGEKGQLASALRDLAPSQSRRMVFAGRASADITDERALANLIDESAPSAIINTSAYTAVDKAEIDSEAARRLNAQAVGRLALLSKARAIPLIHISTDYVFSGEKLEPYVESDVVCPLNVYGATKAEGEQSFFDTGGPGSIVRTSWVFSRYGSNFVKTMVRLAQSMSEIRVVDDQFGRPTHAADLAVACLALVERWLSRAPTPRLLHFAGEGDASWADVAEETFAEVARRKGGSARVVRVSTEEYGVSAARRPTNSRLDTSAISNLGLRVHAWRDRVRACVVDILTETGGGMK